MQVIKQEGLSRTTSECTLFDLFKYNDVNDDEHLTKDEFYAAFGEFRWNCTMQEREIKLNYSCMISPDEYLVAVTLLSVSPRWKIVEKKLPFILGYRHGLF